MSRIGKNPIIIPENVDIVIKNNSIRNTITYKTLIFKLISLISVVDFF